MSSIRANSKINTKKSGSPSLSPISDEKKKRLIDDAEFESASKSPRKAENKLSLKFETGDLKTHKAEESAIFKEKNEGIKKQIKSAIESSNLKELIAILKNSSYANINMKLDAEGNTPLHLAARLGNIKICSFLIAKGADLSLQNKADETPFFIAAKEMNTELGYIFLDNFDQKGYELLKMVDQMTDKDSRRIYLRLLQSCDVFNHINKLEDPVILTALYDSNFDLAILLIRNGADLSLTNKLNQNIFHIACMNDKFFPIVKKLVKLQCNIKTKDRDDMTPLDYAKINSPIIYAYLLKKYEIKT